MVLLVQWQTGHRTLIKSDIVCLTKFAMKRTKTPENRWAREPSQKGNQTNKHKKTQTRYVQHIGIENIQTGSQ